MSKPMGYQTNTLVAYKNVSIILAESKEKNYKARKANFGELVSVYLSNNWFIMFLQSYFLT